jgi:hypothetical protein
MQARITRASATAWSPSVNPHRRDLACAGQRELHQGRVVERRIGLGLGDEGGDAARSRSFARRAEALAVARAGFADKDSHVDDAGGEGEAAAIDHGAVAGGGGGTFYDLVD